MPLLFVHGDITQFPCDAIVNAANPWLTGGGGVDGAIHRAAGPRLHEACVALGGCAVGEAKITDGFDLPCRYIIHTPGPVWRGGNSGEAKLLANCYTNSLRLAAEHDCETVAFPLISSGAYGYPKDEALEIATDTINAFLSENDMTVTLVFYDGTSLDLRSRLFDSISQSIGVRRSSGRSELSNLPSDVRFEEERCEKAALCEERIESAPRKYAPRLQFSKQAAPAVSFDAVCGSAPDLDQFLKQQDEGFRGMLIRKIGEKGWTDAQCYKKANVDRRLFNHIINDKVHNPKKKTVFAFILSLELDEREAREMLRKAGYAFAPSITDKIILWCINNREYDITKINEILFEYDQELLC